MVRQCGGRARLEWECSKQDIEADYGGEVFYLSVGKKETWQYGEFGGVLSE